MKVRMKSRVINLKGKAELILRMGMLILWMLMLEGCAGGGGGKSSREDVGVHTLQESEQEAQQDGTEEGGSSENAEGREAQGSLQAGTGDGQEAGGKSPEDVDIDAELARYRQEREDTIRKENGLIEMGSPDERNYSLDFSGILSGPQLDTRELTEGFEAARIYVTETLAVTPNTKNVVYMCVDPRVTAVYEDEDKGVAKGYDNSNIFLSEFCDENDIWQCLILVREGKGEPWKVIHQGNSYKE